MVDETGSLPTDGFCFGDQGMEIPFGHATHIRGYIQQGTHLNGRFPRGCQVPAQDWIALRLKSTSNIASNVYGGPADQITQSGMVRETPVSRNRINAPDEIPG